MKLTVAPGKYVVAVSGGVDSMVLLDLVSQLPGLSLVVAHFDHGVRPDSAEDRQLVEQTAQTHGLPFIYQTAALGPDVSEDTARKARYAFLHKVRTEQGAQGIILAHHQDDAVETMLLNLIRGTGRRGLSSLQSTTELVRPLLDRTKSELYQYAVQQGIVWREDSTNANPKYLRNYLRKHIIPKLSPSEYQKLLAMNALAQKQNKNIDAEIGQLLQDANKNGEFMRQWFIMLPHAISAEVMAEYLRRNSVKNLDKRLIARLVVAVKTARPHTMYDVDAGRILTIGRKTFQIKPRYS
jgi:tRNA(Ile)-lysidine synthase